MRSHGFCEDCSPHFALPNHADANASSGSPRYHDLIIFAVHRSSLRLLSRVRVQVEAPVSLRELAARTVLKKPRKRSYSTIG